MPALTTVRTARACGWLLLAAAGVAASRTVEPGVRIARVDVGGSAALRFTPTGTGPHPIALLAHGVTASKETMFRLGEALAASGIEAIAIDAPGHGESQMPFDHAAVATALGDATRALGPVDVLVGHSMGAYAGVDAIREGRLGPRLVVAIGASPDAPAAAPLRILVGRFDEIVDASEIVHRDDAQVTVVPWSDHALEPYDPAVVGAAVEAACDATGRPRAPAPRRWRWRLAGGGLAGLGSILFAREIASAPRLARMRGALMGLAAIAAAATAGASWLGAAPVARRIPLQLGASAAATLLVAITSALGLPRWGFAASAAAASAGLAIAHAGLLALVAALAALVLGAAAALGRIADTTGSRREGDVAFGVLVGYALGAWTPLPPW